MAKIPASREEPFGFDSTRVVHTFSASNNEWVATEDCYICGYLYYSASMGNNNSYVSINNSVPVAFAYLKIGSTYYDAIGTVCAPIRKGQTVLINSNDYSLIKCYGR